MRAFTSAVIGFCLFHLHAFPQDITVFETVTLSKAVVALPNSNQWTGTGVQVKQGDTVSILCDGIATTNSSLGVYWTGPEGIYTAAPGNPVQQAPQQCIIGRIGDNGTPFYVGRILAFRANSLGELYLGYNDNIFSDNYGSFVAYVFVSGRLVTGVNNGRQGNSQGLPTSVWSTNYPNPFNPSTTIEYHIPASGRVIVTIFDIMGRLVRTLVDDNHQGGVYRVNWDGTSSSGLQASTGVYICQIRAGQLVHNRMMSLVR